ncbi:MAG: tetratricopeptide repeat protein [Chloroflexi bacterium AL-N10]|nr:tetratricopeptide repeat protein [Chloroflexi bacterium AL-N1]NOK71113.1 tetratricopeptide repeat protein [Chloroflexi bacterium AL-N10]NOK77361.1 tetratricopeptide repeat protein [Chloroflexi bacterium AL-N5]
MKQEATHKHIPATPTNRWFDTVAQRTSTLARLNWPLFLLISIGIALRLWMIAISPLDPRFSNADDGDYYQRALRFAVTGQYIDDSWLIRPPLHVFFFAFWLWVALTIGQPQIGIPLILLAQTAVSVLAIPLGYAIAKRMFTSGRAGLLFAAFLAVWFPFLEQPTVLFSELLYGFLFLLHFWLLLRFDAHNRWRDLALSGLALGAAALTRSPALYSLAFVTLWLLVRQFPFSTEARTPGWFRTYLTSRTTAAAVIIGCCLIVVGPWTTRNYILYGHIIPVDTLGQINVWLDLDDVSDRSRNIETLRALPQAERQSYAMAQAREILAEDPLRPFDGMWLTFQHIWKAQYVEDLYLKQSFFTRPLRESAPIGLFGDGLWLVYTLAGLIGLAAPFREGLHHRLFVMAWLGYSFFTVLVFHVEPRYLVPIWTLIALYGSWMLAEAMRGRAALQLWCANKLHIGVAAAITIAFLLLFFSYRDYPTIIAQGVARERAMVAGEAAYLNSDYVAAEQAYREALAAQPNFVDGQVALALALTAQDRHAEAATAITGSSRQADLVTATIARDTDDLATAREQLTLVEAIAGEDTQSWSLTWLRPPPIDTLTIGNGLDMGYIAGFSAAETGGDGVFRWLEGDGKIMLPLPSPLEENDILVLRMSSGPLAETPVDIRIGDSPMQRVIVRGGPWRNYHLPINVDSGTTERLEVSLHAPTFVPALLNPSSHDARTLSLMVSSVHVE